MIPTIQISPNKESVETESSVDFNQLNLSNSRGVVKATIYSTNSWMIDEVWFNGVPNQDCVEVNEPEGYIVEHINHLTSQFEPKPSEDAFTFQGFWVRKRYGSVGVKLNPRATPEQLVELLEDFSTTQPNV